MNLLTYSFMLSCACTSLNKLKHAYTCISNGVEYHTLGYREERLSDTEGVFISEGIMYRLQWTSIRGFTHCTVYTIYCTVCQCTVEFIDEERLLLKQELLEPEDEFSTIPTSPFLKIPPTVLKAWSAHVLLYSCSTCVCSRM